jgi:hypothetical protein
MYSPDFEITKLRPFLLPVLYKYIFVLASKENQNEGSKRGFEKVTQLSRLIERTVFGVFILSPSPMVIKYCYFDSIFTVTAVMLTWSISLQY